MNQKAVRSIWHPLWLQFSLMGPSWNNSAYYQRLTTHQEGAMVNDDLVEALHTQAGKIVTGQQQSFREARKQFHQARKTNFEVLYLYWLVCEQVKSRKVSFVKL